MRLFNIFKSKKKLRNEQLLKEYEEGKVLQVDNGVDNKEFLSNPTKIQEKELPKVKEKEEEVTPKEKTPSEKWIEDAIEKEYNIKEVKRVLKSSNYPKKKVKEMIGYYYKLKNDRLKQRKTENN